MSIQSKNKAWPEPDNWRLYQITDPIPSSYERHRDDNSSNSGKKQQSDYQSDKEQVGLGRKTLVSFPARNSGIQ